MIVEFAGCTGAGKTTLALGVVSRLETSGIPIRNQCSDGSGPRQSMTNALATPLLIGSVLKGGPQCRRCLRVVWTLMRGRPRNRFWRATRLNAAIRRVGQHLLRTDDRQTHIVDEGVMGLLDLAFSGRRPVSGGEVHELLAVMPLPDIIVWVNAPLEALIDRASRRSDPPRELRGSSDVATCLGNSHAAFGELSRWSPSRVVRVWNPDLPIEERERETDRLAAVIGSRIKIGERALSPIG